MAPKIATHTRIASPSASPDGRGAAGDLCIQEFIEAGVLLAWFWHQSVSAASSRLRLFSNEHQTERGCIVWAVHRPNVWSGRALLRGFRGLADVRSASMYPASDWSVLCSEPAWTSARMTDSRTKKRPPTEAASLRTFRRFFGVQCTRGSPARLEFSRQGALAARHQRSQAFWRQRVTVAAPLRRMGLTGFRQGCNDCSRDRALWLPSDPG